MLFTCHALDLLVLYTFINNFALQPRYFRTDLWTSINYGIELQELENTSNKKWHPSKIGSTHKKLCDSGIFTWVFVCADIKCAVTWFSYVRVEPPEIVRDICEWKAKAVTCINATHSMTSSLTQSNVLSREWVVAKCHLGAKIFSKNGTIEKRSSRQSSGKTISTG